LLFVHHVIDFLKFFFSLFCFYCTSCTIS